MAGIDKTYTSSWGEYQSLVEWCRGKSFTLKNGDIIYPREYIYQWGKEDFDGKKDLPVRCSNQFMDVHIRDVRVEKNSFGGYTDEFVNVY